MNPAVAVSVGLSCAAILFVILFAIVVRLLNDTDAHTLAIAAHAQQLADLGAKLDALAEYLGVDVYASDVDPDWAEQDTEELPAVEIDTVEMHAAWNASAADLVAEHKRQAKRDEWVESELARFGLR